LSSNEFDPRELFTKLGVEAPVTADSTVLNKASLSLALQASPTSAALNDLKITLDDTTFSGEASVPSLDGAVPPLRFDLADTYPQRVMQQQVNTHQRAVVRLLVVQGVILRLNYRLSF